MKRSEFVMQAVLAQLQLPVMSAELAVERAMKCAALLLAQGVPFDPEAPIPPGGSVSRSSGPWL